MSKTEEQAREYLRERNITNSIIKHNEIIEGNFVQTVATLEDVITDFANSQHEQLTKERNELKFNNDKLRERCYQYTSEIQAEKKRVEEFKSFTDKLNQEFKEGKVKLSKPLLDFAKSRKILNNE